CPRMRPPRQAAKRRQHISSPGLCAASLFLAFQDGIAPTYAIPGRAVEGTGYEELKSLDPLQIVDFDIQRAVFPFACAAVVDLVAIGANMKNNRATIASVVINARLR